METGGRHGGLSAAGESLPSVLGCVLRTIVLKKEKKIYIYFSPGAS